MTCVGLWTEKCHLVCVCVGVGVGGGGIMIQFKIGKMGGKGMEGGMIASY